MGATEERIAQFIVDTREKDIPPEAIKAAKQGALTVSERCLQGRRHPPGKSWLNS